MKCKLLDVFSDKPLQGNGLTVIEHKGELSAEQMLAYTRELRQFESIFFQATPEQNRFSARVFTMEEELDFAGHPLLGLAAHLHAEFGLKDSEQWQIALPNKTVSVNSTRLDGYYHSVMRQGPPDFVGQIPDNAYQEILAALNLPADAQAVLPMDVISTGLPYLIVPVSHSLEQARIVDAQFEELLAKYGAQFVYVLDVNLREGRTWDNKGQVEDIATGSAAGPAAAFLHQHELLEQNHELVISQGRFVNRPCQMTVRFDIKDGQIQDTLVGGDVCEVADIQFLAPSA